MKLSKHGAEYKYGWSLIKEIVKLNLTVLLIGIALNGILLLFGYVGGFIIATTREVVRTLDANSSLVLWTLALVVSTMILVVLILVTAIVFITAVKASERAIKRRRYIDIAVSTKTGKFEAGRYYKRYEKASIYDGKFVPTLEVEDERHTVVSEELVVEEFDLMTLKGRWRDVK